MAPYISARLRRQVEQDAGHRFQKFDFLGKVELLNGVILQGRGEGDGRVHRLTRVFLLRSLKKHGL